MRRTEKQELELELLREEIALKQEERKKARAIKLRELSVALSTIFALVTAITKLLHLT